MKSARLSFRRLENQFSDVGRWLIDHHFALDEAIDQAIDQGSTNRGYNGP